MPTSTPTVLITGVAGNLGSRLTPLLTGFNIVGVDFQSPDSPNYVFRQLDLGQESACAQLVDLILEYKVQAVVHLAFVLDPLRTGILDVERMWRINVAGTARVMEAITEANRMGGNVGKLVHLSSVSTYGPDLERPAEEDDPLQAHTLTYAVHKKAADEVVRSRAEALGKCRVLLLRPHIFAGASMKNYMVGALRGTAFGNGFIARRMQRKQKRLPLLLPWGKKYLSHKLQFVHVDDVARLIAFLLRHSQPSERVTVLNVAGRGDPLTIAQCATLANATIRRLPTRALCRAMIKLMWSLGISSVPPDAFPYLVGSYTLDTTRLRKFLGPNYTEIIRYTNEEALKNSLAGMMETAKAQASQEG